MKIHRILFAGVAALSLFTNVQARDHRDHDQDERILRRGQNGPVGYEFYIVSNIQDDRVPHVLVKNNQVKNSQIIWRADDTIGQLCQTLAQSTSTRDDTFAAYGDFDREGKTEYLRGCRLSRRESTDDYFNITRSGDTEFYGITMRQLSDIRITRDGEDIRVRLEQGPSFNDGQRRVNGTRVIEINSRRGQTSETVQACLDNIFSAVGSGRTFDTIVVSKNRTYRDGDRTTYSVSNDFLAAQGAMCVVRY